LIDTPPTLAFEVGALHGVSDNCVLLCNLARIATVNFPCNPYVM
jgi:hypothetical protein